MGPNVTLGNNRGKRTNNANHWTEGHHDGDEDIYNYWKILISDISQFSTTGFMINIALMCP